MTSALTAETPKNAEKILQTAVWRSFRSFLPTLHATSEILQTAVWRFSSDPFYRTLRYSKGRIILRSNMILTPYDSLSWAYELHYYLCSQTHLRRESLLGRELFLEQVIAEICDHHDYHLLECRPYANQFRSLVSLRPSQSVAKTITTIKTNASREFNRKFSVAPPLWARGYLAQSVGHVRIGAVQHYLELQPTHHGYDKRVNPPVYRYRSQPPIILQAPHCVFNLAHHLVLSTRYRQGVFSAQLGSDLTCYWLKVAEKHKFAIDQISVVPDHIHMILRIRPVVSIEECVLLLMNNGQYFVGKHYPHHLVRAQIGQLWQPSAYVGTCGNYTTGLLQHWLRLTP